MLNPPDSDQNAGSYVDLLKRMTQRVQQKKVDDQILEIVRQAFKAALDTENILLTKPEKVRLLRQVTTAVLTDMLEKTGSGK